MIRVVENLTLSGLMLAGLGSVTAPAEPLRDDQKTQDQSRMQQQWGNHQVEGMYYGCITYPGACAGSGIDPFAVQGSPNWTFRSHRHNWLMTNRAIQNCSKKWHPAGYAYWICPRVNQN